MEHKGIKGKKERKGSMKASEKVIRVLESLLEYEEGITLGEISESSGINKATARRIALVLIDHGYLVQSGKRGKYSIGMKFLEYVQAINKGEPILILANPFLTRLSQQVKETVFLNLWDGTKAENRLIIPVDQILTALPKKGQLPALHCTGIGKAILAELPEEEIPHHLGPELERHTPNTITDMNEFLSQLKTIRQEGVAYDDEEYLPGVRSVAAVIKGRNGAIVGAIAIIGPSIRMGPSKLKEFTPVLKYYAQLISEKIGLLH